MPNPTQPYSTSMELRDDSFGAVISDRTTCNPLEGGMVLRSSCDVKVPDFTTIDGFCAHGHQASGSQSLVSCLYKALPNAADPAGVTAISCVASVSFSNTWCQTGLGEGVVNSSYAYYVVTALPHGEKSDVQLWTVEVQY